MNPAADVLSRAYAKLSTAKMGLALIQSPNPNNRLAGLHNAIVFGRSVTWVLQNLRGMVDGFDEWYEPLQEQMRSDPMFKRVVELRNDIEKRGQIETMQGGTIASAEYPVATTDYPPPPGAVAFFWGDQLGGSGWEVDVGNGRIEKFYVNYPGVNVIPYLGTSQGKPETAHDFLKKYLDRVEDILRDAESRFLKSR